MSQLLVDSNLKVTQNLTAPTCVFGKDNCKISIQGEGANEKLLITLPSDGKQNGTSEGHKPTTYDMRSIIESIQELNRRTATFNCNVSFNSALETFDVSPESNDMFACDQDKDGLPAAQIGNVNLPPKDHIVKINVDHRINDEYALVEPRWDSNGNAVYSDSDEYNKALPLKLTLCEAVHEELPVDYIEKIQNYFNGWDTFKEYFSCNGIVAIETIPHIELIDCVDMIVTFRVLTTFEPNIWMYTSPRAFYTETEYSDNITIRYNGADDKFSLSNPLQSPITKMMLFEAITFTEHSTSVQSMIPVSNVAYTIQYVGTFAQIDGLTGIDLTHFDASNVTAMVRTFHGNHALVSITFPDMFDTSSVISFQDFLSECYELRELLLPDTFNTRNAKNMRGMFYNMFSLEILRLPKNFSFEKNETLYMWFYKKFSNNDITLGYSDRLTTLIIDNSELTLNETLINNVDNIYRMCIGRQKISNIEQPCDSLLHIYCYRPFIDSLRSAYAAYTTNFGININAWTLAAGSTVSEYINSGMWEDGLPRLLTKPN